MPKEIDEKELRKMLDRFYFQTGKKIEPDELDSLDVADLRLLWFEMQGKTPPHDAWKDFVEPLLFLGVLASIFMWLASM